MRPTRRLIVRPTPHLTLLAPAADTSNVPEPGIMAVMLVGLASMAAARRRKS